MLAAAKSVTVKQKVPATESIASDENLAFEGVVKAFFAEFPKFETFYHSEEKRFKDYATWLRDKGYDRSASELADWLNHARSGNDPLIKKLEDFIPLSTDEFPKISDCRRYKKADREFLDKSKRCTTTCKGYYSTFERFLVRQYLSYMIREMDLKSVRVPKKHLVNSGAEIKTKAADGSSVCLVRHLRVFAEKVENDKEAYPTLDKIKELIAFCMFTNYVDIQDRDRSYTNFYFSQGKFYIIDTELKSIGEKKNKRERISRDTFERFESYAEAGDKEDVRKLINVASALYNSDEMQNFFKKNLF